MSVRGGRVSCSHVTPASGGQYSSHDSGSGIQNASKSGILNPRVRSSELFASGSSVAPVALRPNGVFRGEGVGGMPVGDGLSDGCQPVDCVLDIVGRVVDPFALRGAAAEVMEMDGDSVGVPAHLL